MSNKPTLLDFKDVQRMLLKKWMPVTIDSVQDLPSRNCYIVNDSYLLSYQEAQFLINRDAQMQEFYSYYLDKVRESNLPTEEEEEAPNGQANH